MRRLNNPGSLLLLLLLTYLIPSVSHASANTESIISLSSAINKAGRQRMLSQRIVKAYSQELLDVQTTQIKAQRRGAIELFARQLSQLRAYAPTERVAEALGVVNTLWVPFRQITSASASRQGLEQIAQQSDELLHASHKVVLLLEELSGDNLGHLVNLAGRQRMLSQRLAKLYMMRALGHEDAEITKAFDIARSDFITALNKLMQAQENSPEINTALREVKRQWTVFEASFKLSNGQYIPLLIAMSSEKVLKGMNEVTGMYAAL